ncbi:hypothetical protein MMC25_004658 [Agyrium rufum]|nr:hypothetical protein [Agyrium rufum]
MVAFIGACAMTLSSIVIPRWISWDSETQSGKPIHYTYGLHSRCSSLDETCTYFPQKEDCIGDDRHFCSVWRSVGFLMSFAVVMEGMTLIAFLVMITGGKQERVQGWKILSGLCFIVGAIQCVGMALMTYIYDEDDRFFPGWKLDNSWILCTVSWSLAMLLGGGVIATSTLLPEEGGYELIPNPS